MTERSNLPAKHLLTRGEAAKALGIAAGSLMRPETHLLRMDILGHTRRFPQPYMAALIGSRLLEETHNVTSAARLFSQRDESYVAIDDSISSINNYIDETLGPESPLPVLNAAEIAGLFCVSRATITGWTADAKLVTLPRANINSEILVYADEVRRSFEWEYPELYDPGRHVRHDY